MKIEGTWNCEKALISRTIKSDIGTTESKQGKAKLKTKKKKHVQ